MSQRCTHRHPDGSFCKRWATRGTLFCYRHQPPPEKPAELEDDANLSPLDRLNSHDDLFDVVRETLNAIRLGRISPGRAYATGYFVDLWMRVRERMEKAGPETKKFHKRRRLSNPVEQALFDVVAEKVVQVMTGKTPEEIERNHAALNAPDEPHWTERNVSVDHPLAKTFFGQENPHPEWVPPDERAQQDAPPSPVPKNWGREDEKS